MDEINNTLAERGKIYGDYRDVAHRSQLIKTSLRSGKNWNRLVSCQRESLEMLANKLARILEGDQMHRDSWHDCVGYMQLVVQYLDDMQE